MNSEAHHLPRIALIGVSGYGRIHLQLLRECQARGEVKFAAAVVINPREEAGTVAELQAHGCVIYDGYEAMLKQERGRIDLCMIPTGIHWHARMTVDALYAGANVLVEKPLAATVADVEAVRRAERATGRFVAVGFQDYYESGTQWLKAQVHAGAIGELQTVRFLGIWPRPRSYYLRNNWAGRLQADGRMVLDSPLNNAFAHFGMLALYFAGPGRDEAAAARIVEAELQRAHAIDSFDTAVVRLRTDRGVRIWLGVSHCCRPQFEPEIRLAGTKGTACWNYEKEAWVKSDGGSTVRHVVADIAGARREMMAAVLARLRDPAVRVCAPEIARHHSRFVTDLHADWPIKTVDRSQIEWSEAPESPGAIPIVHGLEEAMHQAYARQAQLHECGFVLAPPSSSA
jgi:predicted dehydrogenase